MIKGFDDILRVEITPSFSTSSFFKMINLVGTKPEIMPLGITLHSIQLGL